MTIDEGFQGEIRSLQDQISNDRQVMNELRHQIDGQERKNNDLIKSNSALNDTLQSIQERNETIIYDQQQEMEMLRKAMQQLTKAKRDYEKKLIAESEEYENEKACWHEKEAELYNQIRSLSINASEPRASRTPRRRSVTAQTLGIMGPFNSGLGDIGEDNTLNEANQIVDDNNEDLVIKSTLKSTSVDTTHARESKIAQRTIKAQDKLILDLKNEVEKQQKLVQEHQQEVQGNSLKIVHLEHEITNVKQLNRSLMEDNESYQILLHEKTINGEFMMNPIMQVESSPEMKESSSTSSNKGGFNLADELNMASTSHWQKESESDKAIHKLTEENKILQDTNRALQLYMNKILMKIIDNKQLEDVLSIDQPTKSENTIKHESTSLSSIATTNPKNMGPAPTKTVSTATKNDKTNSKSSPTNRQRRRTISFWDTKPPPPPKTQKPSNEEEENNRRHSSINHLAPHPEKSVSTTTASDSNESRSWAKVLRRMSWVTPKEEPVYIDNVVSNDSAVGSLSEEEEKGLDIHSKKSSGSSTPSLRRSNELATLAEE